MSDRCEPNIKGLILVKKGMAQKAMYNNLKTGNTKKLKAQIRKGTVQVFPAIVNISEDTNP